MESKYMSPKEFFDTVVKMREYQKRYFKARLPVDLKESKRLEKIVDSEIERVERTLRERESPRMF